MTPEEAIDVLQEKISPCVAGKWKEAVDVAISALQAQDSKTRKICDTCKHDPPSKKWPCVDCDMRKPADRWEPKDVPDRTAGDSISRQAAIDATWKEPSYTDPLNVLTEVRDRIKALPSVQSDPCEGCKHRGKWENEVEYGYPSPCTGCKRRANDNYEQ